MNLLYHGGRQASKILVGARHRSPSTVGDALIRQHRCRPTFGHGCPVSPDLFLGFFKSASRVCRLREAVVTIAHLVRAGGGMLLVPGRSALVTGAASGIGRAI